MIRLVLKATLPNLIRKQIVDKNGHKKTVLVRPDGSHAIRVYTEAETSGIRRQTRTPEPKKVRVVSDITKFWNEYKSSRNIK